MIAAYEKYQAKCNSDHQNEHQAISTRFNSEIESIRATSSLGDDAYPTTIDNVVSKDPTSQFHTRKIFDQISSQAPKLDEDGEDDEMIIAPKGKSST
jgi:hypothetical protein